MSKVSKMSLRDIFKKTDLIMRENSIMFFCKDLELIKEFNERFRPIEERMPEVKRFLIEHEDSIDKEKMLLLLIRTYIDNIETIENILNSMKKELELTSGIYSEKALKEFSEIREQYKAQKNNLAEARRLGRDIENPLTIYIYDEAEKRYRVEIIDPQEIIHGKKVSDYKQRERIKKIDSSIRFEDSENEAPENELYLEDIIQLILLRDFYEIFPNPEFGEIVRKMILENMIIKENILNRIQLETLKMKCQGSTDDIYQELLVDVEYEKILDEIRNTLLEYIKYVDIDKLLLISAYRFRNALEKNLIEPESHEQVKKILRKILENIKDKKIKMYYSIESEDGTSEIRRETFSVKDIEKCLDQFMDGGYLTTEEIEEYRKNISGTELTLFEVNPKYIDIIYTPEELAELAFLSDDNFNYVQIKLNWNNEQIQEALINKGECSVQLIMQLANNNKLDNNQIIELYKKNIISIEQIKEIQQYRDLSKAVNSYELIEYYNNSIQKDSTEEEKASYDRYANLYKAVLVDSEDKEEVNENSNILIEQLIEKYEGQDYINAIKAHYSLGLLTLDSIAEWSGQEVITALYNDKLINLEDVMSIGLKLGYDYINNIYNQLVYSAELDYDERIKYLETGFIGEDTVIDLYNKGLIMDNDLRMLAKKAIIREDIAEELIGTRDLDDRIKAARAKAIGWTDDRKIFDVNILQKKHREKSDTLYDFGASSKKRTIIDPNLRQEYIEMLGLYRIAVECEEDSPFYHYEFYATPDESGAIGANSVIIAERYYQNKDDEKRFAIDNATYFFKYKDFLVLSNLSKQDMVKEREDTVFRASHTVTTDKRKGNWAENVLFNVLKTMMDSDLKGLSEREKRKKLTEIMSQMYTKEECDCIFDLCKRIDSGESLYIVDRSNDRTTKKTNAPNFDDDDDGLR